MENKRERTAKRLVDYRLLTAAVIFAAVCAEIAAQTPLTFRAEKKSVLLSEQIVYTLSVPGVSAGDVAFGAPNIRGLVLLSTQKSNAPSTGKPSASIRLIFRAEAPGVITPPPLTVAVGGKQRTASFEAVTVKENPAPVSPRIDVLFEGDADGNRRIYVGAKLFLVVSVQNAASVENFDWELNANSMIREISRSVIPGGQSVRFEWIPLMEGTIELPRFAARVKNFSGAEETVRLSGITVRAERAENSGIGIFGPPASAEEEAFLKNVFAD
jgi:hypothetical protein